MQQKKNAIFDRIALQQTTTELHSQQQPQQSFRTINASPASRTWVALLLRIILSLNEDININFAVLVWARLISAGSSVL